LATPKRRFGIDKGKKPAENAISDAAKQGFSRPPALQRTLKHRLQMMPISMNYPDKSNSRGKPVKKKAPHREM